MNVISQWAQRLCVLLVVFGLVACGDEREEKMAGEPAAMGRIEGSVIYRERMMLPPGFDVEIQLQDISRADAMATTLASVLLTPEGAPPYNFVIDYDPATIDSRLRYALRATISNGEQLLFTSTDYIDPFKGNPVEILVRRVPEAVRREGPSLGGGTWVLQTLAGEPASPGAGGKPVDIQFTAGEQRAAGFSGCNRYTGSYVREGVAGEGSPLKFGPMAGTMMACEDGGELEQNYLQILNRVTAFRLDGDILSLLAGSEVLATFKSA
jgi:putative lipoprotein